MNIQPLGDRVVIKRDEQDQETKLDSGIYIAGSQNNEGPKKYGTILEVGPGNRNDAGETIPLSVSKGDRVVFSWGETVTLDGEEYEIVSESNILGIIK